MRDYTSKQHSHQDRSACAGEGARVAGSEAGGKRAFGMRRRFPLGPRSCPREQTPIPGETPILGADTHPRRCGDPAAAPCWERRSVPSSPSYLPLAQGRRARHGRLLPQERCARAGRGAQTLALQWGGCPGSPAPLRSCRSPLPGGRAAAARPAQTLEATAAPARREGGTGGAAPPPRKGSREARSRPRPPVSERGRGCGQRARDAPAAPRSGANSAAGLKQGFGERGSRATPELAYRQHTRACFPAFPVSVMPSGVA